jgi:hypothetical protein
MPVMDDTRGPEPAAPRFRRSIGAEQLKHEGRQLAKANR